MWGSQSEYESSCSGKAPPSDSNQGPSNNSLGSALSLPEYRGSVAASYMQENLESKHPSPPKFGHHQSSPYFREDSASYGSPLADSRLRLGIQQCSISAFDDIRSQSTNNAALDHPRAPEPRTWGAAHDTATNVFESPLYKYSTQGNLQSPDDPAMHSCAPNSSSASCELATNLQSALQWQAHSSLPRPLGQSQTSYNDPNSVFLNPGSPSAGVPQHPRATMANNGWQSEHQRVPGAHPPPSRSNQIPPNPATATSSMWPVLLHGPWSQPAFGFLNNNNNASSQPAQAVCPTQHTSYMAPDASTAATNPASTHGSNSDQHYAPWC